MSLYLNKNNDKFKEYKSARIFIDKSNLIKECNSLFGSSDKYMCITRPRRFGKTMALSMLNAYYSKGCDSLSLFDKLNIANDNSYLEHLNKHNVIWIDMVSLYTDIRDKNDFLKELETNLLDDLNEAFPNVLKEMDNTISKAIIRINSKLNERFIFLIDEWDVIYREEGNNVKLCNEYTEFLSSLFKSSDVSACIDLVYMTGILPIRRTSSQTLLNNFELYDMIDSYKLAPYIGFTEDEVIELCNKYHKDFNEIKRWYKGYILNGISLYNPISVVEAVLRGKCKDYWNRTSSIEALTDHMNYGNGALKDEVFEMLLGNKVSVNVRMFSNDLTKIDSKDSALTALIHLGYLTYDKKLKVCYIPNYEIKKEFEIALEELKWN